MKHPIVLLFKTFGMQNGDMVIFILRSSRKVILRKMQFLEDAVQTVADFDTRWIHDYGNVQIRHGS